MTGNSERRVRALRQRERIRVGELRQRERMKIGYVESGKSVRRIKCVAAVDGGKIKDVHRKGSEIIRIRIR